jgi:hypothetical protein
MMLMSGDIIMPRLFEVNTDNEVLCYLPSGKVTTNGQQRTFKSHFKFI